MMCSCGCNRSRSTNGGPSVCVECGYEHPERPWTIRHGDRLNISPDMPDEFNHSAGTHFSSRRDMREWCKITGNRPVEAGETSDDPGEVEHMIDRSEAARSRRIRNPECGPLRDHMYEMFQTMPVGQEIKCRDSASPGSSPSKPSTEESPSSAKST